MVRELRGGRELLRNGVAGEVNMGVFGIKKFRRIGYSAKSGTSIVSFHLVVGKIYIVNYYTLHKLFCQFCRRSG